MHEQVSHAVEFAGRRYREVKRVFGVDPRQEEPVDGALAQVFGDFRTGVISAEGLLVDVFLEDVAQHVRVDLVIQPAGGVIEVPRIGGKQTEQVLECGIGNPDGRAVITFQAMGDEQATIEVTDVTDQPFGITGALLGGLGKTLEKQRLQETRIETVLAPALALGQLVGEITRIATVEKVFALQEPDEHEPVHERRRIPAALPLVGNALNQFDKDQALGIVFLEELLGDPFHVQRGLHAVYQLGKGEMALIVQLVDVHHDAGNLGDEQVARLAFDIQVFTREALAAFPLDPEPEALGGMDAFSTIHEEDQVLVGVLGQGFMDGEASGSLRQPDHHEGDHAGEFGNRRGLPGVFLNRDGNRLGALDVGPAQLLNEQAFEVEGLETVA